MNKVVICFAVASIFLMLTSCDQTKRDRENKFTLYYNNGEQLYKTHCANCHQVKGSGLGRLYPPVANSDFMQANFNEVLCLMRYGRSGRIIVNGIEFNKEMPGIPTLSDLEVAEIATYIYNAWTDKKHGIIEVKEASTILSKCDSLRN